MVTTLEQEAPTVMATDLAARKLRLIELILGIEEESALLEIEGIVFDFSEDEEDASDEEIAFVAERIAEAKANPDAGIRLEQFMRSMKNRLRQ